ncbi:MAG: hypothetical protein KME45_02930 [Stenomitos rutilans HA7619-LM2]|jgi:hypothetical protein|nr:hypothetical protein [Stenomitos rutilans HA7619-LM2]MBW4469338.1 hypothetical protein [Stenomitos rutilans HA7619-LM2]
MQQKQEPDRYTELVHLFKRLRPALSNIYRDNLKNIVVQELTKVVETAEAFAKQNTSKRAARARR